MHNQAIKYAPFGRPTLASSRGLWRRYVSKGSNLKFFIFVIVLTLTACTSTENEQHKKKETGFAGFKNGDFVYEGTITKNLNQDVFDAFRKADTKPKKLIISSPGGEISLGMELGEWVSEHNLDLEVSSLCASSCANYVFTAANKKYLRKSSVLIWHGSAWQENWNTNGVPENFLSEYLIPMRERETALFEKLGVDNLLTVYGQTNITFWQRVLHFLGLYDTGWDYSLEDMNRFGISNIILIDKEWDWRKYRPNKSNKVLRVKVSKEYTFKLRRFET